MNNLYSPLCTDIIEVPFFNERGNNPINFLTVHCTDGLMNKGATKAVFNGYSCNYLIDANAEIVGVVNEARRSWCSSSRFNDFSAITIEVASDRGEPCKFPDKCFQQLVELTVDIMKRHGKKSLLYIPEKDKALSYNVKSDELLITFHKWFAADRSCPGGWFISKCPEFIETVNKKVSLSLSTKQPNSNATLYRVQVGAFAEKTNAEKLQAELKAKGYDAIIKEG
ncbi:MAG: N-acetylmuramoyl-L-alanine amidase [bacterium]|nr:N-acetylmuramoyl-L-alanine amidase [bacterium]